MGRKLSLTLGICAHNEERNIGILLPQLLGQELHSCRISEIIVVSSGSTDKTDALVKGLSKMDGRIRLISERERKGKIPAVNRILRIARGDVVVLCGADLQVEPTTLERLAGSFSDPGVGMAGARPVPTNSRESFCGFCAHLIWGIHHQISLRSPKCGELVAFRNRNQRIPGAVNADEAWLEWRMQKDGWKVAYVPEAIVRNRGPENIPDFIRQRRRNHVLHMNLERFTGYRVSTENCSPALSGAVRLMEKPDARSMLFLSGAVLLEGLSRVLAAYDFYIAKNDHAIWDMVQSTKAVRA